MAHPPVTMERERRQAGRVPFVRRCTLLLDDARVLPALLVNINLAGAYVARDDLGGAPAAEFEGLVIVGRPAHLPGAAAGEPRTSWPWAAS